MQQPPPIDRRTYADLVAETEDLATRFSEWRPRPDGPPDAGGALIRVFGRFAELVVERLNRAPAKHFLAFLNLLGAPIAPPQAARVPLTFTLAEGSPVDAVVPAGTQVAGPPQEGETEDVVFETELNLVVTRARLVAAFVSDTEADAYADRTGAAAGEVDRAYPAFTADVPSPHHLYLACDAVLATAGPKDVGLILRTPDGPLWNNWPVKWSYWDGGGWREVQIAPADRVVLAGEWRVVLRQLPALPAYPVHGVEAGWVRAELTRGLRPPASGLLPESVAIGARNPQDLSFPLALFGDAVTTRRAYLSATEAFSTAGALVRLRVRLARRGTGKPLLTWVYQAGDQWRPLGQSSAAQEAVNAGEVGFRDGTRGLTRDGEITFFAPRDWARTVHRTRSGHWLRIDVEGEGYTATPLIASLEADFDWVLPRLGRILIGGSPASTVLSHNDFQFVDHTAEAAVDTLFPPFIPTADNEPALYLGLDRPFDPQPTSVYLQVEPPRPEEVAADSLAERDPTRIPEVVWEYVSPTGWRSLRAVDGTRSLTGRGAVTFLAPEDLVARSCFGRSDYWLRARWTAGVFPVPPRLRRVLLNTTWAVHGETIADEVLGSSNGNPDLVFVAAQRPLQPGRQLRVREPEPPPEAEERALAALEGHGAVAVSRDAAGLLDEVWVRWHEVPDLYGSQPRDRHYTMDALTGEVRFGDGVHGMIPPPGQGNVRLSYRTGGGPLGNRGAGSVAQLRSAIPYVESVINHEPAIGGAAAEPIERYQDRGPRVLRHRNRAVAAQDLEDLAAAASPEVARVAAVVPRFNPFSLWRDAASPPGAEHLDVDAGRMGVVIVPNADDQRPTPSLDLLRRVKAYLEERCPVTADVWVAGPEWIAVAVTATVVPTSFASAEGLADRVRAALSRYLHPLTGGADGQGWVFGRKPQRSQLYALIEALEGVDHVDTLTLAREPATGDAERKLALQRLLDRPLSVTAQETEVERELRRWLDRALIYSGRHDIDVAWR